MKKLILLIIVILILLTGCFDQNELVEPEIIQNDQQQVETITFSKKEYSASLFMIYFNKELTRMSFDFNKLELIINTYYNLVLSDSSIDKEYEFFETNLKSRFESIEDQIQTFTRSIDEIELLAVQTGLKEDFVFDVIEDLREILDAYKDANKSLLRLRKELDLEDVEEYYSDMSRATQRIKTLNNKSEQIFNSSFELIGIENAIN